MTALKNFAAVVLLVLTSSALAQSYPSRAVTFVVPFAPGGGTDITARTVAAKLTQMWNKTGHGIVVENRGGAGGVIGVDVVAKAKPDGHTLLIANVGTQSINPTPKMTHVPYKGGGPAMIDLMAGHVDLLFASVLEGSGHIKAGKLKGLAVTHAKRNPALPDVPTIAEAGVPGGESGSWIALLAVPQSTTPAELQNLIDADLARYGKIIREKGLKAE